jgi:hypothetical protein
MRNFRTQAKLSDVKQSGIPALFTTLLEKMNKGEEEKKMKDTKEEMLVLYRAK